MSEVGILYAVELQRADTFRGTEYLEGQGVFFHAGCYPPGITKYRRKSMPDNIDDGGD